MQYIKDFYKNQNQISLQTILTLLETKLPLILSSLSVSYNLTGIKTNRLKGIKIRCKGRLGNTRNPLTQTLKKSFGSTSLPKINSYIDYHQDFILTKRGTYGIKI